MCRLEALRPGEAVRRMCPGVHTAFRTTYKDGQCGLLQMSLEELEALDRGGLENDAEGVNWSATASAATLIKYCVVLSCS